MGKFAGYITYTETLTTLLMGSWMGRSLHKFARRRLHADLAAKGMLLSPMINSDFL